MLKKIIIFILILSLLVISKLTPIRKDAIKNNLKSLTPSYNFIEINEKPIGKIIITKININNNLYKIESTENNIEKNITILKGSDYPNKENSTTILAAHSGEGEKAFFKNLDKLTIDDEVIIIYNNEKFKYVIKNIWEEEKNGYINFYKSNCPQLIITTCSPNNKKKQLIIDCSLKES